ncbi:YopX family protein [Lactiplantibacillus plantarum]|nr:YopX family protein [Lactiplantibacillus plantarum]WCE42332.1 YopX family protein [Lactiplantibacillus plantarum]WCE44339.1 YopX family protein [Lactiplantibacillus plantarum]WCE44519.1 YopX family protein [Lactiplantibacillus plantarum]
MATMIKFRAWNGYRKIMADYVSAIQNGDTQGTPSSVNVIVNRKNETWDIKNDDVKLLQFTGLKDVNGKEIYEGDIVQPIISYTKRNIGKPFEVKKGNYVYGKWIAKDVSSKEFGVDGYYFSNEMRLIGNVHTNHKLLEEEK